MKRSYDDNHRSADAASNNNTSPKKCRFTVEMKRKRIIRPRRFDGVDLDLELEGVYLLEPPSLWTLPSSERSYQVVWWIDEPDGRKHISEKVTGSPNLKWEDEEWWRVGLKGNPVGEDHFVNLEVLRYNSLENRCDPGTSGNPSIGEVMRARVPFPTRLEETTRRRYELAKPDGEGNMRLAGDIELKMSLETWTKEYNRSTDEMERNSKIIRKRRFHGVDLYLELEGVDLLDPPSLWALPSSERSYRVVWWIDEPDGAKMHISDKVTGSPNPKWEKERWYVGLKGKPVGENRFVNLEVLKYNSTKNRNDPGTSNDPSIEEVIRARVPFPERLEDTIRGWYELVKLDGEGNMRPAGDINLKMSLETWTKDYYR